MRTAKLFSTKQDRSRDYRHAALTGVAGGVATGATAIGLDHYVLKPKIQSNYIKNVIEDSNVAPTTRIGVINEAATNSKKAIQKGIGNVIKRASTLGKRFFSENINMKPTNKTLVELNARLDLVLFGRHEEDHTARNIAIGAGGLGLVGAGGYAVDKYMLQPRMGLINNNNSPHNRVNGTKANAASRIGQLTPEEIDRSERLLKKHNMLPAKATRWQAAKSIGDDYLVGGAAGLGKMFPETTQRFVKASSGRLAQIAAAAAHAVKH